MNILLISTYDLGRQPFGLASPAAWLRDRGFQVTCVDTAVSPLPEAAVKAAHLIGLFLPMHTATRLAAALLPRIRQLNPQAHLCCYGLYAPLNEDYLRRIGADTIIGGEYEAALVEVAREIAGEYDADRRMGTNESMKKEGRTYEHRPSISLQRLRFIRPQRSDLPSPEKYARLCRGSESPKICGNTQTTRGCLHTCRHCPIVPVYNGHFRVVQRDVVLEDIRRQVAAGAQHITFGDPDFFNGPGHVLPIVAQLHREFPDLTYDVTIKVSHLLKYRQHLALLRDTGCAFITSAVESLDDRVLSILDKGHTVEDFYQAVRLLREIGLVLNPTFIAFTPWTSLEDFRNLLSRLVELDLIEQVAPIQLGIRLLIPQGSRLLELPEIQDLVEPFDESRLIYPWRHRDSRVDELHQEVMQIIGEGESRGAGRREIFAELWQRVFGVEVEFPAAALRQPQPRATIPYLNEPWYC